jgi:hypothetical protein
MITFDYIENYFRYFCRVWEATNRDGKGAKGRKCPTLVRYIGAVARTVQAWSG